jgi:demethylmenaquinone methyltransferase/2-methoxy-6-polyprenyl-1,4-benzoquinol methylase
LVSWLTMSKSIALRFFKGVYSTYDTVVRIATFYQDDRWKSHIIRLVPASSTILDLGCGTGILTILLKEKAPKVYGIDIVYRNLYVAMNKIKSSGEMIELVNADAENIPFKDDTFDVITASYISKYVDAYILIGECRRVLKDNGTIILHDFTYPKGLIRYLWHLYFLILRFAGIFVGEWRCIFNELDKVIAESRWVDDTIDALKLYGFKDIGCDSLTLGTSAVIYARGK